MRWMQKATGDRMILRGVNLFPIQIEEVLRLTDWCGGHFIIELTRDGRMDEMTVHAEARPEHWDGCGLGVSRRKGHGPYQKHRRHQHADPHRGAGDTGAVARQGQAGGVDKRPKG
jgi:hypothetical protein